MTTWTPESVLQGILDDQFVQKLGSWRLRGRRALDERRILYRGWTIDRYRQPDSCFYAYAPDYDGLTPSDTQSAPALHELCEQIDEVIASRDSDGTATAAVCEDIPAPQGCQARAEGIAQKQKP